MRCSDRIPARAAGETSAQVDSCSIWVSYIPNLSVVIICHMRRRDYLTPAHFTIIPILEPWTGKTRIRTQIRTKKDPRRMVFFVGLREFATGALALRHRPQD